MFAVVSSEELIQIDEQYCESDTIDFQQGAKN